MYRKLKWTVNWGCQTSWGITSELTFLHKRKVTLVKNNVLLLYWEFWINCLTQFYLFWVAEIVTQSVTVAIIFNKQVQDKSYILRDVSMTNKKHLMTGPLVNFAFLKTQNSLFPKGPVIKWFVIQQNKTKFWKTRWDSSDNIRPPLITCNSGQHFAGNKWIVSGLTS